MCAVTERSSGEGETNSSKRWGEGGGVGYTELLPHTLQVKKNNSPDSLIAVSHTHVMFTVFNSLNA